jgi:predicted NUDIX family NTP pyrophosphohydrolase
VLLVHPGGPLYAKKDEEVWSVPKGELDDDEDHLRAAYREFEEELGMPPPDSKPIDLGSVKLKSGKLVCVWAVEGDLELTDFKCNTFTMEWPPKSGRMQEYPECDRADWFGLDQARQKLHPGQHIFLDRLIEQL